MNDQGLVWTDDIEELLQRSLTVTEETAAEALIRKYAAELESICNRPLTPRVILDEQAVVDATGFTRLRNTPVVSVTQIRFDGAPWTGTWQKAPGGLQLDGLAGFSPSFTAGFASGFSAGFSAGSVADLRVAVDYSAGLEEPANGVIRSLLIDRVIRTLAKITDDALGVSALTQEGYNAPFLAEGWTEQELALAQRARRRVVR
jgi:hypothetical protein